MYAINIENLHKSYGANKVLNGINLSVSGGEFYALMGPNGSGKTTLSSIIASVATFDSGTLEIFGKKPEQAKRLIGYVPQDNFSSLLLTGRENLTYFAGLLGYSGNGTHHMVEEMLNKIGLAPDADKRVSHYSGGMRKKLEAATALFPGIRILILDEPTTGLDPRARRDFFSLIQGIKDENTSIFLITHIGTDAELATRVGLIDKGKIIAEDTPDALKAAYTAEDAITIDTSVRNERAAALIKGFSSERKIFETETGYRIYAPDGGQVVPKVARTLDQAGYRVTRTEVTKPTLEDVFFKLTDRTMQEVNNK
ncbi:MAG: ABC transporter ATP-binding protein [Dehalococcoidia bacterium]|jgi:ABC-2 type transport system ATP-binding protein